MKILSVEPTPSPNSMKLNMDEKLPEGVKMNFTKQDAANAPEWVKRIFAIEGIKSVYHVSDFIAVERYPNADWKEILSKLREVLGEADSNQKSVSHAIEADEPPSYGEVKVLVQMFRGIPTQVKLEVGNEQTRFGLPERFAQAVMKIQEFTPNYILERRWEDRGVRYGEVKEIGEEVVKELSAAYDEERLNHLVQLALEHREEEEESLSASTVNQMLDNPDWEKRFAALERLNPTSADIPVLVKALEDSNVSIRRLATVYFGMIGGTEVLPYLFRALKDKSVIVRRTAGDVLSDLGDPDAIPAMVEALKDPNKLVRWRAARFLYEVGDETALPALREAENDPEFEISLQVKMAIERIESGEEASGTVWQQMTRAIQETE